MGSYVGSDFKERYLEKFPRIPIALQHSEDIFIAALEQLGFFQYRKGGDGGFDYGDFCAMIRQYAELFSQNPKFLDNIVCDISYYYLCDFYVSDYKKYGQVAPLNLFLEGMDEKKVFVPHAIFLF